ncbi:MAG: hypothetical protein ACJAZN_003760 [Planctomycetota bacterium]|jgi:hypothetical protein
MKNTTLLLAALVAVGVFATCSSCTGSKAEINSAEVDRQAAQEPTDDVTFHVIGMKKTASGAT